MPEAVNDAATIRPFVYEDNVTGQRVQVKVSPGIQLFM